MGIDKRRKEKKISEGNGTRELKKKKKGKATR